MNCNVMHHTSNIYKATEPNLASNTLTLNLRSKPIVPGITATSKAGCELRPYPYLWGWGLSLSRGWCRKCVTRRAYVLRIICCPTWVANVQGIHIFFRGFGWQAERVVCILQERIMGWWTFLWLLNSFNNLPPVQPSCSFCKSAGSKNSGASCGCQSKLAAALTPAHPPRGECCVNCFKVWGKDQTANPELWTLKGPRCHTCIFSISGKPGGHCLHSANREE